jgi:hypothetical protein
MSNAYEKLDQKQRYLFLKQHLKLKESLTLLNNEKLGIDDYENFKELKLEKLIKLQSKENKKRKQINFFKLINI